MRPQAYPKPIKVVRIRPRQFNRERGFGCWVPEGLHHVIDQGVFPFLGNVEEA